MRRFIALLCAVLLLAGCFGGKESPIRDGKSLGQLMDEVRASYLEEFGEEELVVSPKPVDLAYLCDLSGIEEQDLAETAGWVSMSMTRSDAFVALRAKEGKAASVAKALSDRVLAMRAQYEVYPVEGSYERAQAARVFEEQDYVFLIAVGDGEDCDDRVEYLIEQIRSYFP